MHPYSKTFRKRWPLYVLIPLAVAIAVGILGSASKSYASSASLWVDYDASSASSLNVTSSSGATAQPAAVEQTTLTELLSTTAFGKAVAAGAGVPAHERAAVARSLPKAVISTTPGPQILNISYTNASGTQAQRMVRSLIKQLQVWTDNFEHEFNNAATKYNKTLYESAATAVAKAKKAVNIYHAAHPRATTQNDQNYATLVSALAVASSSLYGARTSLDQEAAQAQGTTSPATVTVVDGASPGVNARSSKKKLIVKALGAGIGGALVSFILVVAATPAGRRRDDDEDEYGEDPSVTGADRRNVYRQSRKGASSQTWTTTNPSRSTRALPAGRRQLEDGSDEEETDLTSRVIRVAEGGGRRDRA